MTANSEGLIIFCMNKNNTNDTKHKSEIAATIAFIDPLCAKPKTIVITLKIKI